MLAPPVPRDAAAVRRQRHLPRARFDLASPELELLLRRRCDRRLRRRCDRGRPAQSDRGRRIGLRREPSVGSMTESGSARSGCGLGPGSMNSGCRNVATPERAARKATAPVAMHAPMRMIHSSMSLTTLGVRERSYTRNDVSRTLPRLRVALLSTFRRVLGCLAPHVVYLGRTRVKALCRYFDRGDEADDFARRTCSAGTPPAAHIRAAVDDGGGAEPDRGDHRRDSARRRSARRDHRDASSPSTR